MDRPPGLRLLVGGLSPAITLGIVRSGSTCAASERSPAPVVPGGNTSHITEGLDGSRPAELEGLWRALVVFLVLSMVIESALTPLFNWRIFLRRFLLAGGSSGVNQLLKNRRKGHVSTVWVGRESRRTQ
jgi:hypothetical protein